MANFINTVQAIVTTGQKASSAVNMIKNGKVGNIIPDLTKSSPQQGVNLKIKENALEQFASYSFLWTLAALEPRQFNDPRSYRGSSDNLKHIVFSSAGRYDSQRVAIAGGVKPEYYLDNFVMNSVISASQKTGNSNAINFSFDIYEPYSMGLFLQSLQIAALNAGHPSYLQSPYVLKLDFKGFKDDGTILDSIVSKYFTVKFNKVEFDTTESGSNYKCTCIPFNHQGFSKTVNRVMNDIAIEIDKNKPSTVKSLLWDGENSLCAVLNREELKLSTGENRKKDQPDVYEIQFPKTTDEFFGNTPATKVNRATVATADDIAGVSGSSSTIAGTADVGDSDISSAGFGIDAGDGGNVNFKRAEDVIDEKTGKIKRNQMIIDPKNRKFQFSQGQNLTQIITQVILSSDYALNAITKKPGPEGFINWFKIDVQIQLGQFDDKRGDFAKKIIYRVLPYRVHQSIFSNPTSTPLGLSNLEKLISKKYNYIYTGENNDLINFNITINNLFFAGSNPKPEEESGGNANVAQKGTKEEPGKVTKINTGASGAASLAANTGSSPVKPDVAALDEEGSPKGGGAGTTEEMVARSFHRAFLNNSSDLINIDFEILGDLYYLIDSGIGNYFSPESSDRQSTEDGSMNYEGSDVYVYIRFRTPTDINQRNGLYDFSDQGKDSPFSGIYKIIACENIFSDGIFKQKLKAIRIPRQPLDYDGQTQPLDATTSSTIDIGEQDKPKTTVIDDAASIPARLRR